MKRSPIKTGRKSIERGSTFAAKPKPLDRKPARRPARDRAAGLINRQATEAWAHGARAKRCAVCRAHHPQGHHVITQQQLRKTAATEGLDFDRLRWDDRNRLPLCDRCHAGHHSRHRPVTIAVLREHCPKVFQFARELGLTWWLVQTYPDTSSERSAA